jgi:dTDP-4-dehydrorhamnose 3,5-epimerase
VKFEPTDVDGCFVVHLEPRADARGWFARAWCADELGDTTTAFDIVQINDALTVERGTIRGLHWQVAPHGETKFIRCVGGAVFDVCVDVRAGSPTAGAWVGVELSAENRLGLLVPRGCAHGYQSLTDDAELLYASSARYRAEAERGARYDDPAFGIQWPAPVTQVSDKDLAWGPFQG